VGEGLSLRLDEVLRVRGVGSPADAWRVSCEPVPRQAALEAYRFDRLQPSLTASASVA
jgi:hypothetical protein